MYKYIIKYICNFSFLIHQLYVIKSDNLLSTCVLILYNLNNKNNSVINSSTFSNYTNFNLLLLFNCLLSVTKIEIS